MPQLDSLYQEGVEQYAIDHSSNELPVLHKLTRATYLRTHSPNMLSGHLQGNLLQMISSMIKPRYILEIGTFTGYSAICLAQGLQPNGKLITIDHNMELRKFATQYFEEAGFSEKIELLNGDASSVIPTLDYPFDLAFIDADKDNYILYFNLIWEKLNNGGFILVDNTLWHGKVLTTQLNNDKDTLAVDAFNKYIKNHPQAKVVLLPFRDGLTLIQKIS